MFFRDLALALPATFLKIKIRTAMGPILSQTATHPSLYHPITSFLIFPEKHSILLILKTLAEPFTPAASPDPPPLC